MRRCTLAVLFSVIACGTDGAPGELEPFCEAEKQIPVSPATKLDLLFVVDNSMSMSDDLATIAQNVPRFASVLEFLNGGVPDLHIGVVTTDPAERGVMREPYLIHERQPWFVCSDSQSAVCAETNFGDDLGAAMTRLTDVGADSADTETTLENLTLALEANPGFLRADAYLFVVILTDEDDESTANVFHYLDLVAQSKPDPARVYVAAAIPEIAPRISRFLDELGPRGTHMPIDSEDLSELFSVIVCTFCEPLGAPCLEIYPDGEPECAVTVDNDEVLPACEMATPTRPDPSTPVPCYWIEQTLDECKTGLAVRIEGMTEPGVVEIRCETSCES